MKTETKYLREKGIIHSRHGPTGASSLEKYFSWESGFNFSSIQFCFVRQMIKLQRQKNVFLCLDYNTYSLLKIAFQTMVSWMKLPKRFAKSSELQTFERRNVYAKVLINGTSRPQLQIINLMLSNSRA